MKTQHLVKKSTSLEPALSQSCEHIEKKLQDLYDEYSYKNSEQIATKRLQQEVEKTSANSTSTFEWRRKFYLNETILFYQKQLGSLSDELPQEVNYVVEKIESSMTEAINHLMLETNSLLGFRCCDIEEHIESAFAKCNKDLMERNKIQSHLFCSRLMSALSNILTTQHPKTMGEWQEMCDIVKYKFLEFARGPAKYQVLRDFIQNVQMKPSMQTVPVLATASPFQQAKLHQQELQSIDNTIEYWNKRQEYQFSIAQLQMFESMFEEMKTLCIEDLIEFKHKYEQLTYEEKKWCHDESPEFQGALHEKIQGLIREKEQCIKELEAKVSGFEHEITQLSLDALKEPAKYNVNLKKNTFAMLQGTAQQEGETAFIREVRKAIVDFAQKKMHTPRRMSISGAEGDSISLRVSSFS